MAGVDTKTYQAHSFRHASTSSAEKKGVPLDLIFANAGWSPNSSVFAKYYKLKVDNRGSYGSAILSL
jgi:hypothetical protein